MKIRHIMWLNTIATLPAERHTKESGDERKRPKRFNWLIDYRYQIPKIPPQLNKVVSLVPWRLHVMQQCHHHYACEIMLTWHTWSAAVDSSLGRESINTSTSLAVLAISAAKSWAYSANTEHLAYLKTEHCMTMTVTLWITIINQFKRPRRPIQFRGY